MDKNQIIKLTIASIVLFALGAAIGRYTLPEKVVEKIVYKETEKKDESTDTTEVIIKKPDGTVITKKEKKESKSTTSTTEKSKDKEITNSKDNWTVSAAAKATLPFKMSYGIIVDRRILGPIHAGAFVFTDKSFGASVGLSF